MEISATQVCEELLVCFKKFKMSTLQLAEAHGLTPMQLYALHAVQHGDVTMGQVAIALHCDASNVTGIVDRLVTQQLLVRTESMHDRRTKELRLTAKGREIIEDIDRQLPLQLGCDKLKSVERATLHQLIAKLSA
jgi:DNA-binding MarR family transcriptional regulator